MQRRTFLQQSTLALFGLATTGRHRTVNALNAPSETWSIVTDQPDEAIASMHRMIRRLYPEAVVRFEEHPLVGRHMGDVVLVSGKGLVDYRTAHSHVAEETNRAARMLRLPRPVQDPVLLQFSLQRDVPPTEVQVYRKNLLLATLPLAENCTGFGIDGTKGRVTLAVRNRQVRITQATCKHRTCMQRRAIGQAGEALICVPNGIRITLNGTRQHLVDGITY